MITIIVAIISLAQYFPTFKNWLNTNINIMITMLFGGLWHGSSWNFVIWGGLNGFSIVFYKLWRKISPWEKYNNTLARVWKITLALTFISFTRIFFRAANMDIASNMMHQISTQFHASVIPQAIAAYWFYYLVMVLGYIIHWLSSDIKDWYKKLFVDLHWTLKALVCVLAIYLAYQSLLGAQPFIYFQF